MESNHSVHWLKAWGGAILSTAILNFFAISIQLTVQYITMNTPIPFMLTGIVFAILYPLLTFLCLRILIEKLFKIPLKTLRFTRFKINPGGILIAALLPCSIILAYCCVPGEWLMTTQINIQNIIYGIIMYGIAVGITEEMVSRGVIMGLFEKCYNIRIAIILSSVLFASMHVINGALSLVSFIQLIAGLTAVGVLLALIGYRYNSFWNNALVHAVWNSLLLVILSIAPYASRNTIWSYVLESRSIWVTGGEFGFEASAICFLVVLIFIAIMRVIIKKRPRIAAQ